MRSGSETNVSLFDDTKGIDANFDRGSEHVDRGDFGGGIAVAAGPYSDRPEGFCWADYADIAGV